MKTVNKLDYIYKKLLHEAKLKINDTIEISNEEYENIFRDNEENNDESEHDYIKDYLTFEALEDTTFTFSNNALQYSLDDGNTWTTLGANIASPIVTSGNKILWKQTGLTPASYYGIGTFSATGNFKVSGNIMSLYYGDNFIEQNNLTGKNYAFYGLFNDNNKLVNAENLVLPATILTDYCYSNMFIDCTALTTAPELLATTLADYCYACMFTNCTSLTTAPELPATTLADYCYECMFSDCISLTTAPELPATTLADSCYKEMFYNCTSLTIAPELPATTLTNYCYCYMFYGCVSLTTTPKLLATTLASYCYHCMFYDCKLLINAPELPATTLENGCYYEMFSGCTSLTTAPELLATTLADYCYACMFSGCTLLNYIKCLAITISSSNVYEWVESVASTGTFIKDASMTSLTTGSSGIPKGWTVQELDPDTGEIVNEYIAE